MIASPTPRATLRVLRGGGWNNNLPTRVRAANRNRNVPANRNENVGFRCARETTPALQRSRPLEECLGLPPPGGHAVTAPGGDRQTLAGSSPSRSGPAGSLASRAKATEYVVSRLARVKVLRAADTYMRSENDARFAREGGATVDEIERLELHPPALREE